MKVIFSYLAIVNLLDGIFTYVGLQLLVITEVNPLMNYLYEKDPLLFMGMKFALSITLGGFILLNKLPTTGWVRVLATLTSIIYTAIFILHGFWIIYFI
ncbi:DUF5658 family protein [Ferdinandcohnia quinoae]|uniref:DUF5658 family protein n=1 Tax=Fredinandcohnia quinoae TaxID=2918902 RepID=A0AAW5E6Y2_9BACI|nr:DUF5658 family protein [Fredinandcohnia sp. SECRCQ15]MCH1624903.1 DUF5658 family protein [Fredinandcohnia sp. SECRCQ15]